MERQMHLVYPISNPINLCEDKFFVTNCITQPPATVLVSAIHFGLYQERLQTIALGWCLRIAPTIAVITITATPCVRAESFEERRARYSHCRVTQRCCWYALSVCITHCFRAFRVVCPSPLPGSTRVDKVLTKSIFSTRMIVIRRHIRRCPPQPH